MKHLVLALFVLSVPPSLAVDRPCPLASHTVVRMMFEQAKGTDTEQVMLDALKKTSLFEMGEIASSNWTPEQCEFLAVAGEPVLKAFAELLLPKD